MLLGEGLITSEGAYWKQQRKLIQPFFGRQALESLVPSIVHSVTGRMRHLRERADRGAPTELNREMVHMTACVIGQIVMGVDVSDKVEGWHRAVEELSQVAERRVTSLLSFPRWIPTPLNCRIQRCRKELHALVTQQMDHAHRCGIAGTSLLSRLMTARDEEGRTFTRQQVRDQALTLLLAGHLTTATALTWTLYLLCKHPEVQQEARKEAREMWNEGPPTFERLEGASLIAAVFSEALRLYPPAVLMSRQSIVEDVVLGRKMPIGARFLVSPYLLHRHVQHWNQPTLFNPERFLPGGEGEGNIAFIPFGSGPRGCVGAQLAGLEARVILSALLSHFSIRLVESCDVLPRATIALRPSTDVTAIMTTEPSYSPTAP
jgi:cytochrome P450